MLLDLKDRAALIAELATSQGNCLHFTDAVNARTHLGYSPYTAQKAVQQALEKNPSCDLATLISTSLQHTQ
jgi:Holliday junction resolvasome RuvABC DNA-binding subunit